MIEYFDAEEEDIEHHKAAEAAALANSNSNSDASPSSSSTTALVKMQTPGTGTGVRDGAQDHLKDYLANMPPPTTVQLERLAKAGMPLDWTARTQQVPPPSFLVYNLQSPTTTYHSYALSTLQCPTLTH